MLTLNAPLAVRAVAVGVGGGGIQALRPLRCGRLPLVLVVVVVLVVLVVVVLTNGRRRRRHVYRCKHPPPAMFTDVTPRPHRVYRCKPLPRHYVAPHYPITPPALSHHAPRTIPSRPPHYPRTPPALVVVSLWFTFVTIGLQMYNKRRLQL